MRARLSDGLGKHPFYRDLRGRGLLFSLEYICNNNPGFAAQLTDMMRDNSGIMVNAKWHRVSFAPAYIMTEEQGLGVIDALVDTFKLASEQFMPLEH